jgi:hypothetical protein
MCEGEQIPKRNYVFSEAVVKGSLFNLDLLSI